MKYAVASFFLFVSLLPIVAPGQIKDQAVKRSTPPREAVKISKSRREPPLATQGSLIKICQGIPIPDGYVIVAYETSSACLHGAYLLKKDDMNSRFSNAATARVPQSTSVATQVSRPRRVRSSQADSTATELVEATVPSNSPEPELIGTATGARVSPTLSDPRGAPIAGRPSKDLASSRVAPTTEEEVGPGDVVRIDTNLVTVPVSVLDRQGRFVPDLRRENFRVFENGVEQRIAYFEPTEKPFTVALLLDTSASTTFHLSEIKEAAIAFAKKLRPQDSVLVVTFNEQVLLLTEATNDLNVVTEVIEQNANTGSSTRLYDAVDLVINERLNNIKGRKAIVLFTDGVDTASYLATYNSTLRAAEELDALIYPIEYDTSDFINTIQNTGSVTIVTRNSSWPFPGRSSSRVVYGPSMSIPGSTKADYARADRYLHDLADKTGARLYRANDASQLADAFSRIAEELRRQYSLSYYPPTSAQDGERRAINVRVNEPDLAVRARASYVQRVAKR
jgi:VWFA-related protein